MKMWHCAAQYKFTDISLSWSKQPVRSSQEPEDGGGMLLSKNGKLLLDYVASHPRRYERGLLSLWPYKENKKLRDWKNVCTYSPVSSTHLWLCCSNFNPSKKNSFGCAANRKIGSAKDLRASLCSTLHCSYCSIPDNVMNIPFPCFYLHILEFSNIVYVRRVPNMYTKFDTSNVIFLLFIMYLWLHVCLYCS
jgi:hypothetical protein